MANSYQIEGGRSLKGDVSVSGSKNAVLPLIASSLLFQTPLVLKRVPKIADVLVMVELFQSLGGRAAWQKGGGLKLDSRPVRSFNLDHPLTPRLRASILFLGPLLARFGRAVLRHPGGCVIGRRPLGTHLMAMKALGAKVEVDDLVYKLTITRPSSRRVFLDEASVTATENAILFSAWSEKPITIADSAMEPHVRSLAEALILAGVLVEGLGSPSLTIYGRSNLKIGRSIEVIGDEIEAATFIISLLATGGEGRVSGFNPLDLEATSLKLIELGAEIEIEKDGVLVKKSRVLNAARFQARPYPGISTDTLPLLTVLATKLQGTSLVHDWLYERRLGYVDDLTKMGANITLCDPHRALVSGPTKLFGATIESPDIRAGAALVLAALLAKGRSKIAQIDRIERGYEDLDRKFRSLGARISRRED